MTTTSDQRARTLAALEQAWAAAPWLRLGQLLTNAVVPGRDLFYYSDEELIQALDLYRAFAVSSGPRSRG